LCLFQLTFLFKLVEGVATSSFGTHVANLAGVPRDVVERADTVSKDFAKQFKDKVARRQEKSAATRLPLVAQADFVYLYRLATGLLKLPEDPVRQREVLVRLRECVRRSIQK
jgi:DNA mismatch repair protein MSH6